MELIKFEPPSKNYEAAIKLIGEITEKYSDIPVVTIANDQQRMDIDLELRDLATHKKNLEALQKAITSQIDEYKTKLIAPIKLAVANLVTYKSQYDEPVKAYNRILRERAEKEAEAVAEKERQRLLAEQLDAELIGFDTKAAILEKRREEVVPQVKPNKALTSGSGTTRQKKWELVDINLVPAEYKKTVLDEDKIKVTRASVDFETTSPIPGVRFFYEESLRTRSF